MKKIHFILILIVVSFCYIAFQLYFIKHVPKQGKIFDSNGGNNNIEALTGNSYENIKTFVNLCEKHKTTCILIDPAILRTVMNNTSHSNLNCKYLCSEQVTTFAVLSQSWEEDAVLRDLKHSGYVMARSTHEDPRLLGIDAIVNLPIPVHYFFARKNHIIHLVVLYERNGHYWWHAPVRLKTREDKSQWIDMKINLHQVRFGKTAGAYDILEVVKVKIDGVSLNTFRFPFLFLDQIPHSRFTECNHVRAKLFYSQYSKEQTAAAIAFKQKARNLLEKAKTILDSLGVRFWLSSGTCLGWFRQCDIIPYSKDVDIGIWIKDYTIQIIPSFQRKGLSLKHAFGKISDSYELSFQEGNVKLDIFFFYEEDIYMWNGGTQAKTGKKFKYFFPKFTLCWTEFLEMKVRVPCETESYIEANYGKQWFTPVKVWDWKKSPPNVRENGEWPVSERDKVIQTFPGGR